VVESRKIISKFDEIFIERKEKNAIKADQRNKGQARNC
jgi:hypothetical protein